MIHARALIVGDYTEQYSHWEAELSLGEWLKQENIPGIYGMQSTRTCKISGVVYDL